MMKCYAAHQEFANLVVLWRLFEGRAMPRQMEVNDVARRRRIR